MQIKPIGNRILVQPLKQEEITASGIVLPASAEKEKKAQGKIIALGNGEDLKKLGLKEGDMVVFGKYSGEDVEVEKVEYKILYVGSEKDHSDVLAVME
ncbi:MAG: chaperonin Cpn10 [Candidatus Doudnabacteria bacterium]|nr:chaperonin Cpn10 [Candidatus Doudnabacteria bacterium]